LIEFQYPVRVSEIVGCVGSGVFVSSCVGFAFSFIVRSVMIAGCLAHPISLE